MKPYPLNAYETKEYLDINFHRERMNFLSNLVLPSGTEKNPACAKTHVEHLWQYTLPSHQMLLAYRKQSDDGFLIPNWTYVQGALKRGFGILYCALTIQDSRRQRDQSTGLLHSELDTVVQALRFCGESLAHITTQWQTVKRHAAAFMQMSESVLELIATPRAIQGSRAGKTLETTMIWKRYNGIWQPSSQLWTCFILRVRPLQMRNGLICLILFQEWIMSLV